MISNASFDIFSYFVVRTLALHVFSNNQSAKLDSETAHAKLMNII